MKRVMIVGGPGSGKSTLARLLGEKSGLPVFHMDHIHWQPGWIERSNDEKDALCHHIHMRDEWIFEGGNSRTYAERLQRADTLIWLDFPLWIRIKRVLVRSIKYQGKIRPDMPMNCPERFNWATVTFLMFMLQTRNSGRNKLSAIYQQPPEHLQAYQFSSLKKIKRFLVQK